MPDSFRWHSGDIQVTFRWHSGDIQVTFMRHSCDTHYTFRFKFSNSAWQMQGEKFNVTNVMRQIKVTKAMWQMQFEKCNVAKCNVTIQSGDIPVTLQRHSGEINDTFRGVSWDIFQHSWVIKIQIYKISVTNKVWHVKYDKCNVGQIQYDKCYVSNLLGQMQWGK